MSEVCKPTWGGEELEGILTMPVWSKDEEEGAWIAPPMPGRAFVCTPAARSILEAHLGKIGHTKYATFETKSPVFNDQVRRWLGPIGTKLVVEVGLGSSRDMLPQIVYDDQMQMPDHLE